MTTFDGSTDGVRVLGHAGEEAKLRSAPLGVLACWRPTFPDIYDAHARASGSRMAKADLQRSLQ